jgi:hypothetical protein
LEDLTFISEHGETERAKVHLIETDGTYQQDESGTQTALMMKVQDNNRYVTLSHCWGKPNSVQEQLRLNDKTEGRLKEGVELQELPKTFRDALKFACRLEKVGYVWIDSLCIKQPSYNQTGPSKESTLDWLQESRVMDQIYRCAFLNISATAATNGDQGLFSSRRPEYLWEDEINVNYTGTYLFGSIRTESTDEGQSDRTGGRDETQRNRTRNTKEDQLTRCTLIDDSFWEELVERAPVNCRGWVLQERLMAPRVLHFCRDQIAWECAEFEDAEGHPEMNSRSRAKLKDLTPKAGLALRDKRLNGLTDPDKDMADLGIYELWKQIVEVYSKTQLTVSSDKLIALSGIARRFYIDPEFFKEQNEYIAGMWSNNLASQLIWQVNERFEDGVFENPARRDATRAPSFSWASIDTPHGITHADVTDYRSPNPGEELLLTVLDHSIRLSDTKNPFGMIKNGKGRLLLRPRFLKKIELRRLQPPFRVPYSWRLKLDQSAQTPETSKAPPRHIDHFNLYLDAPESDVDIFKSNAKLYCMPVAYGERTVRKSFRYVYCLLLKFEQNEDYDLNAGTATNLDLPKSAKYRVFRRIGIAKLSSHADERLKEAIGIPKLSNPADGNEQLLSKEEDAMEEEALRAKKESNEVICLC